MVTKSRGARENETQFADRRRGPILGILIPWAAAGKDCLAMNLLQGHEATCPMLVSYSAADGELDALSVDPSD
jgi:hypothetical protein